jgi:phosphoribosylformylglycinamidine cyclo-ligase
MTEETTYKSAGVDVDENELANSIAKRLIPVTFNESVVHGLEGMFSAGIRIDKDQGNIVGQTLIHSNSTDDIIFNLRDAISIMEERGLIPLCLTDYIAFGKLDALKAARLVLKVIDGSRRFDGSFVPVIGGEIAEMPGVIKPDGVEFVASVTFQKRENFVGGNIDLSRYSGNILTTSIDSVGTKTKLGRQLGRMDGLFNDMIGHSVGDIVVQGSTPLGVAMYVGSNKFFQWDEMASVYKRSVSSAKLTDIRFKHERKFAYHENQFDIVGSVLGILDENKILSGDGIKEGDHLIGLKSFGVNTNGYSLIRSLGDEGLINYDEKMPGVEMTVGDALMRPHENYQNVVGESRVIFGSNLKGIAHITGGGIEANTSRLIPKSLVPKIENLPDNPVFSYLQDNGGLSEDTMDRTFNRGVGLVFAVDNSYDIRDLPRQYHRVGRVARAV